MAEFNWSGETYTEKELGGDFIDSEEFNRIMYRDEIIFISGVREGVSNFDPKDPKEQWLVDFVTERGEAYTKGLVKGNEERDSRIKRLAATIEATGEPVESSPFKVGKRIEFGKPKR